MTYARFLGLFVALPLLVLLVLWRTVTVRRLPWKGLLLLVVVYVATSPWDNVAVKWGLWGFPAGRSGASSSATCRWRSTSSSACRRSWWGCGPGVWRDPRSTSHEGAG